MKENDIYAELSSIRNLMERSTKFISLSGLSGILAGIYVLAGAFIAYRLSRNTASKDIFANNAGVWQLLALIATVVLLFSLATGLWLTIRQARKKSENPWNPVSKRLLFSLAVPLISGGFFILILFSKSYYALIPSMCLLFYGLALVAGSQYTLSDIKWLGYCDIALGLLAAMYPAYGVVLWITGFGILHIIYGSVMHFRYKQ